MNEKEIQGIICFIVFFLLLIVFAIRHIINERKKHGKYLTRIRLVKWALYSVLFVISCLLLYLTADFIWVTALVLITCSYFFVIIGEKFNDD